MEEFKSQLTETFTTKFDRLEQVIAAMAAPNRTTEDDRRDEFSTVQGVQNTTHPETQDDRQPHPITSQTASNVRPLSFIDGTQINQTQIDTAARTLNNKGNPMTSQVHTEASATLTSGNNNEPSPAWLISQALGSQSTAPMACNIPPVSRQTIATAPPCLPTSATPFNYDQEMEAKVNHILSSTAHTLAAGPGKTGFFPHRYVSRGPDRKRPTFNMLSLSEHVWGIFMLIKEKKVPAQMKPSLYKHIQDIIEDTCMYDWATAVRPWSEEVFSQVDEGRLEWADSSSIQMLRMSMSRPSVAKIDPATGGLIKYPSVPNQHNSGQSYDRSHYRQNQNQGQGQVDVLKGGPPCEFYNSQQGCTQRSGHLVRGQKMIHVCCYCLYNTSASHQHPETQCRNKGKFGPSHF